MLLTAKRPRILALDQLRGFFLVVILIDHLGMFPSPFEFMTGRGLLWASAAEGFFLISGLLVGYVYAPRMSRSFKDAATKIWRRAVVLFAWAVGLTIVTVLLAYVIPSPFNGSGLWRDPSISGFLYQTLSLQYSYGWADFLKYYAVYMLFAPLALWLCLRSKAWLVVIISVGVWLLRGELFLPAWQLLFMGGLVAGYYLPVLQQWYLNHSAPIQRILLYSVYSVTLMTVVFSALTNRAATFLVETYGKFTALPEWIQIAARWLYDIHLALEPWTTKDSLEPLRLVTAVVWFTALYLIVRHHEVIIERVTRGSLRILGENSLFVYVVQSFIVFGVLSAISQDQSIIVSTFITAAAIVAMYGIVRMKPAVMRRLLYWRHDIPRHKTS